MLSHPAGNQDRDHAVCILQVALSTPKQVTSHEAATQMESEVFRACAENGAVGTRWVGVVTWRSIAIQAGICQTVASHLLLRWSSSTAQPSLTNP